MTNEDVLSGLRAALSDQDSLVRQHAAVALGRRKDPKACVPLLSLLWDESTEVGLEAFRALGMILGGHGWKRSVTSLEASSLQARIAAIVVSGSISASPLLDQLDAQEFLA